MNEKQIIAQRAAQRIENNMLIGLGTGSTANLFIAELAQRVQQENLKVTTVSSSVISGIYAKSQGLCVISIEQCSHLDVYVDGADEVTPDLTLLKGRGSDLVKEKLLARASAAFLVIADSSKQVKHLGERNPIPVEVMPFAWQLVQASITKLGGKAQLRPNASQDGLAVTAHGSLVLDVIFEQAYPPAELNMLLNAIPGVVEHGIFYQLATEVITAD